MRQHYLDNNWFGFLLHRWYILVCSKVFSGTMNMLSMSFLPWIVLDLHVWSVPTAFVLTKEVSFQYNAFLKAPELTRINHPNGFHSLWVSYASSLRPSPSLSQGKSCPGDGNSTRRSSCSPLHLWSREQKLLILSSACWVGRLTQMLFPGRAGPS